MPTFPNEIAKALPSAGRGIAQMQNVNYAGASAAISKIGAAQQEMVNAGFSLEEARQKKQKKDAMLMASDREVQAKLEALDLMHGNEEKEGLYARQGKSVLGLESEYEEKFSSIRERSLAGINDPDAAKALKQSLDSLNLSNLNGIKTHESRQRNIFNKELATSTEELSNERVKLDWSNDATFQKSLSEAEGAARTRALLDGVTSNEGISLEIQKAQSKIYRTRIDSLIEQDNPKDIVIAHQIYKKALADGFINAEDSSDLYRNFKPILPKAKAHETYTELKTRIGGMDNIKQAAIIAAENGIDPEFAAKVAMLESNGIADAKNPKSSAEGIYQFTDGTAERYGLVDKIDVSASSKAFADMTKNNIAYLTKKIGREPTGAELYMAHQQGEGGAAKLLQNPMRLAVNIVGRDAVLNNGGTEDMTAADFTSLWERKYDSISVPYSQDYTPSPETIMKRASEIEQEYAGSGVELVELFDRDNKAQEQLKATKKAELQDSISKLNQENNGDWTRIPASMRAEAARYGIDVTTYKGVSSPDVKTELDAMPSSMFFTVNFNDAKYAQGLTYSDRQEYIKKQQELAKPENKYMADMVDGVVGYYFRAQGEGDPNAKANKEDVAAMKNYVMFKVQESMIGGKAPTKKDVTGFASEYLPLMNKSQASTVEDIDESLRQKIETDLMSIGVEPTEQSIMAVYLGQRKKNKQLEIN